MRRKIHLVPMVALACAASCKTGTKPLDPTAGEDAGVELMADVGVDAGLVPDAGLVLDTGVVPDSGVVPDAGVEPDAGLGKAIGEACTDPAECRSADSPYAALWPSPCIVNGGNPWPDGYCTDYCQLPADPFVLPLLVRADCPEGAVCLPRSQASLPGDIDTIGACFVECTTDEDCRIDDGYYCRHSFYRPEGDLIFENGLCEPNHCQSRGCPYSFVCGC